MDSVLFSRSDGGTGVDPALAAAMFRMRKRAFADRRQWRVTCTGGAERDRFDDLRPLYLCMRWQGLLRLLPTTGPYMLRDVFPALLGGRPAPRDRRAWEVSRFCVDREAARLPGAPGSQQVTRFMLWRLFRALRARGCGGSLRGLRPAGRTHPRAGGVSAATDRPGADHGSLPAHRRRAFPG